MTNKLKGLMAGTLQLIAICLLLWLCNQAVLWFGLPIPGSVIGLAILLVLLFGGVIPEKAVKAGAAWLIGELVLFFLPPIVSLIKYQVFIFEDGFSIIATIVVGTLMVLAGTAWVVDRIYRYERRLNQKRLIKGTTNV